MKIGVHTLGFAAPARGHQSIWRRFCAKGRNFAPRTLNHEAIHTAQMKEMLFIFSSVVLSGAAFRLAGRKTSAYRRISFEREAYYHEHDKDYLKIESLPLDPIFVTNDRKTGQSE